MPGRLGGGQRRRGAVQPSHERSIRLKGPLFQYSMPRGDRYPNQDSRIFFGLSYVKIRVFTLGEPTRAPNSRIYDVGSLYSKVRKLRGYANPCSMAQAHRLPPGMGEVPPGQENYDSCTCRLQRQRRRSFHQDAVKGTIRDGPQPYHG